MKNTLERISDNLYRVFGVDSIGVAKWITALVEEIESLDKERAQLRGELARAVRDIARMGTHTASIESCHVCATVRSYGFDPEALREEVGAGGAAE